MTKKFFIWAHVFALSISALAISPYTQAQVLPSGAQQVQGTDAPNRGYPVRVMAVDANGNPGATPARATSTVSGASTSGTPNTYTSALASNSSRSGCLLQNTSANTMRVFVGAPGSASDSTSLQISAGGTFNCRSPGGLVLTDQISVASSAASATYVVVSQ